MVCLSAPYCLTHPFCALLFKGLLARQVSSDLSSLLLFSPHSASHPTSLLALAPWRKRNAVNAGKCWKQDRDRPPATDYIADFQGFLPGAELRKGRWKKLIFQTMLQELCKQQNKRPLKEKDASFCRFLHHTGGNMKHTLHFVPRVLECTY